MKIEKVTKGRIVDHCLVFVFVRRRPFSCPVHASSYALDLIFPPGTPLGGGYGRRVREGDFFVGQNCFLDFSIGNFPVGPQMRPVGQGDNTRPPVGHGQRDLARVARVCQADQHRRG